MKNKKMDRYLIAANQTHEVNYVVAKMKKEGIEITAKMVAGIIKEVGNSRRKVYAKIRESIK